jgi:hypothetical protein
MFTSIFFGFVSFRGRVKKTALILLSSSIFFATGCLKEMGKMHRM